MAPHIVEVQVQTAPTSNPIFTTCYDEPTDVAPNNGPWINTVSGRFDESLGYSYKLRISVYFDGIPAPASYEFTFSDIVPGQVIDMDPVEVM
jgi:hypothetical protein